MLLGVGSVVAALGLTALVSRTATPVDQNTQSLVLLIGLAVGVDYALFVIRRAREERAAGASVRESVNRAGATAGRAVLISGMTVVVAMSGMLVARTGVAAPPGVDHGRRRRPAGPGVADARHVLALLGRRAHTGPRWIPRLHH